MADLKSTLALIPTIPERLAPIVLCGAESSMGAHSHAHRRSLARRLAYSYGTLPAAR